MIKKIISWLIKKRQRSLGNSGLIGIGAVKFKTSVSTWASAYSPNDFVVVSYGTRDTEYEEFINRLRLSCEECNIENDLKLIPNSGRVNACLYKPSFLKFMLITHDKPILWLDADSVIEKNFSLPSGDWDMSFITNNFQSPVNKVGSWAVCFRPTLRSLRFLELWEQLCSTGEGISGLDPRRLNYTRDVLSNEFVESSLDNSLISAVLRDVGTFKEN